MRAVRGLSVFMFVFFGFAMTWFGASAGLEWYFDPSPAHACQVLDSSEGGEYLACEGGRGFVLWGGLGCATALWVGSSLLATAWVNAGRG